MENKVISETSNTEMVTIPRAEYEHLQAQNQWLMEQFRLLKKKVYGSSSEKASEEVYEQLSLLFNEAEAFVDAEAREAAKTPAVEVKAYTNGKGVNGSGHRQHKHGFHGHIRAFSVRFAFLFLSEPFLQHIGAN